MTTPHTATPAAKKTGYHHVPTPMGTAIVGPCSDLVLPRKANFADLTYHAIEGIRIWLENGAIHEFMGKVCVRGTKDYKIVVNTVDGAAIGAFLAVHVFAITPLKGSTQLVKEALKSSLANRSFH